MLDDGAAAFFQGVDGPAEMARFNHEIHVKVSPEPRVGIIGASQDRALDDEPGDPDGVEDAAGRPYISESPKVRSGRPTVPFLQLPEGLVVGTDQGREATVSATSHPVGHSRGDEPGRDAVFQ